jgi:hypothetical protein
LNSSSSDISIQEIIEGVKHHEGRKQKLVLTWSLEFELFEFHKMKQEEIEKTIQQEVSKKKRKRKKENEDSTNFKLITVQLPLKIELKYIHDVKNAIHRKLDYYLLKYDDELNGVIIAYQDIELLNEISNVSYNPDDTHVSCFIQATLLLFCPLPNSILTGTVNHVCFDFFLTIKIDHEFITLTVHGIFNARILKKKLKENVSENDRIEFKILNCDKTFYSFIIINGTQ